MIATATNWRPGEPQNIWAEYDVTLNSLSGELQSGFYFEGVGGAPRRHLHIDFTKNTITLKYGYTAEGPTKIVAWGIGIHHHFMVVANSPRYRVYVDGALLIDYADLNAAISPAGFGFDCASGDPPHTGTGSISITNLSLYTANNV
jgi:hypothetical protein